MNDEEGVIVTEEGDSIAEDPLVNGSARGEEEGMFVSKGFGQSVSVDIITGCKENGTGGGTNEKYTRIITNSTLLGIEGSLDT